MPVSPNVQPSGVIARAVEGMLGDRRSPRISIPDKIVAGLVSDAAAARHQAYRLAG
jgi:hypothetical protein